MFGDAARDFLDVTRCFRSHPACMSTSTVVIASVSILVFDYVITALWGV